MLNENPFEVILLKLEHLQSTVNDLSSKVLLWDRPKVEVESDPIMNLPEAAEILKKPVGTVRYYIHHRGLPAKKVGKSFIIKHSDLFTWLETFSEAGQDTNDSVVEHMLKNRKRFAKK